MKRFTTGLIVGKFAPLHCGHETLIREAVEQCETLLILSYSVPELPGCEPHKRLRWLQQQFPGCHSVVLTPETACSLGLPPMPHNDDDADLHRHFVASVCELVFQCRPQAVFTAEAYGDGFAAVLSERFQQPVAHVRSYRPSGTDAPSGTLIRADVHRHRALLAPPVYRDFVQRICLLGGESTGKSTLTVALAKALGTGFVAEYGRERWEEKQGNLEYDDLLHIAFEQVRREESAAAHRYLVCDTSPLTTLFYTLYLFGRAPEALFRLAERPYALIVLCEADFPFVQDGTRQDESFRLRQQGWYEDELTRRGLPFIRVRGTVDERIQQVKKALAASADPTI